MHYPFDTKFNPSPTCVHNFIHVITFITENAQFKQCRLVSLHVKMVGKRSVHWLQIRFYIFSRQKNGQSAKTDVYGHNEVS